MHPKCYRNDRRVFSGAFDYFFLSRYLLVNRELHRFFSRVVPWVVNHKKTQGLQKFFFHDRFSRAFLADHFGKKIFLNRSIIFHFISKILSKSCKMLYKGGERIRPFSRPLSNQFISIRLESGRVPDHIFLLNSLKIHLDHFRAWGTP